MKIPSKKTKKAKQEPPTDKKTFICTSCGGEALVAYGPERGGWGGLVRPGEQLCLPCGKRRGINFF